MTVVSNSTYQATQPEAQAQSTGNVSATPQQQAAAARIRVAANSKRGRTTEAWIKKLAKSA
jgi:hypothetical protein